MENADLAGRQFTIFADRGLMVIYCIEPPPDFVEHFVFNYDFSRPEYPLTIKECLARFQFEKHELGAPGRTTGITMASFPLWCILLPCSIAPILWLRKRRRLRTRGFPVEPATSSGSG
jgi:hypothetical protein